MNTTLTKLEAINRMLGAAQLLPIASLNDMPIEGEQAESTLDMTSIVVQSEGLKCNTEHDVELSPDDDGFIHLPANTISVRPTEAYKQIVQRGSKLYDLDNRTNEFDSSVTVSLITELEWDDLPPSVQHYIIAKASRDFYSRIMGSDQGLTITERDEQRAYMVMRKDQVWRHNMTMTNAPGVQRIVHRLY